MARVCDTLCMGSHRDRRKTAVRPLFGSISAKPALHALIGLLVAVCAWAISSPPRSTPDEILHIANIWCANSPDGVQCLEKTRNAAGEQIGVFGYRPDSCFWRDATLAASCADSRGTSSTFLLMQSETYYHPLFQKTMNLFVGQDGSISILLMKLINVAIFSGLLMTLIAFAPVSVSRGALSAISLTISPLSVWLIASINPSGWGISGLALIWAYLIWVGKLIRSRRGATPRTTLLFCAVTGLVISLVLAVGARQDSMLFAIFILATISICEIADVFFSKSVRTLRYIATVFLAVAGMLVFLIWFTSGFGFSVSRTWEPLNPSGPSLSIWFTSWLTHFPLPFLDAYGYGGLGENEIRVSIMTTITSLLVLGGGLAFAAQRGSWRQLTSLAILGLSFLAMLWFASLEMDLYNVPGRYVIPLFPAIVGTYIYYSRSEVQFFDVLRLRHIAIGMLGIVNALSLYAVVERYSAGSSAGLRVIPVRFDEWWWDFLPIGPNGVVVMGSVSWVVFLVYAFRFLDQRKLREANA